MLAPAKEHGRTPRASHHVTEIFLPNEHWDKSPIVLPNPQLGHQATPLPAEKKQQLHEAQLQLPDLQKLLQLPPVGPQLNMMSAF